MPGRKNRAPQDSDSESNASANDIPIGEAPTTINPYAVLSLSTTATASEIKSAYRRAALKHHPDKAAPEDRDAANAKFQEVALAYAVLSDERRRRRYDLTGSTAESLEVGDEDGEFDWAEFYTALYTDAVTEDAIRDFAAEWRESDEEKRAVLDAYTKFKGRMERVFEEVMLSDMVDDEERYRVWIDKAIADGEVEAFEKYTGESETARKRRIAKAKKVKDEEAKEAEGAMEEVKEEKAKKKAAKTKDKGLGDLAALIQQRQKGREQDFFSRLEEKYAPKGGKRGAMTEPSEEAFAKNAKKAKRAKK